MISGSTKCTGESHWAISLTGFQQSDMVGDGVCRKLGKAGLAIACTLRYWSQDAWFFRQPRTRSDSLLHCRTFSSVVCGLLCEGRATEMAVGAAMSVLRLSTGFLSSCPVMRLRNVQTWSCWYGSKILSRPYDPVENKLTRRFGHLAIL